MCGVPTLGLWPGSPRCAPSAASPACPVLSPPAGGRAQEGRSFHPPPCLEPSGPGQVPKHLRRLRARLKPLFFWLVMAEEAAQGCARGLPAPRLSVHTSGRAVLISPNLLIPALEFTNSCESREHSPTVWKQPHHQDGEAGARPVEQLAGGGLRRREELLSRPLLQALPGSQAAPAQLCCQENRATLLKSTSRPRRQQGPRFRHRVSPASSCAPRGCRGCTLGRARCQGAARDGASRAPRDKARTQHWFGKSEGHWSVSCQPWEPGPRAQLSEAGAARGTSAGSRTVPGKEPWEPWWLPQPRDKACPGWEHLDEQHWHPSQVLQSPHEHLFVTLDVTATLSQPKGSLNLPSSSTRLQVSP